LLKTPPAPRPDRAQKDDGFPERIRSPAPRAAVPVKETQARKATESGPRGSRSGQLLRAS